MQEAKIRYHKNRMTDRGAFKQVFNFVKFPQYVVKIWSPGHVGMVKREYNTAQKYPDLFAKIIKIISELRWMVDVRLDTKRVLDELDQLADYLDLNLRSYVPERLEALAVNPTQKEKTLQDIQQNYPEAVELFNRWMSFFEKITQIDTAGQYMDFNAGNIGYDKNGNLKLLDI